MASYPDILTPKHFTGEADAAQAITFLSKFKAFSGYLGLDISQQLNAFSLLLTQKAATWYATLNSSVKAEWKTLEEAFLNRYGILDCLRWKETSELFKLDQQQGQPVLEYIENMCFRGKLAKIDEDVIIQASIRGVQVDIQRFIVERNPKSITELKNHALLAEASLAVSPNMNIINERITSLSHRIHQLSDSLQTVTQSRGCHQASSPTRVHYVQHSHTASSGCSHQHTGKSDHPSFASYHAQTSYRSHKRHPYGIRPVQNVMKCKKYLSCNTKRPEAITKPVNSVKSFNGESKSKESSNDLFQLQAPVVKNTITIIVKETETQSLLDSGASISCVSESFLKNVSYQYNRKMYKSSKIKRIVGVGGETHQVLGTVVLPINIQGVTIPHEFHIFSHLHYPIILGVDFMQKHNVSIDFQRSTVTIPAVMDKIPLTSSVPPIGLVRVCKSVTIPANSEAIIPVRISNVNKRSNQMVAILEPMDRLASKYHALGARCLVRLDKSRANYRLLNFNDSPIDLPNGCLVAIASAADVVSEQGEHVNQPLSSVDPAPVLANSGHYQNSTSNGIPNPLHKKYDDNNVDEGYSPLDIPNEEEVDFSSFDFSDSDLTRDQKDKLLIFLKEHKDVFACNLSQLGSTNLYAHKIDTGDHPPVKQAFYRTNPSMRAEISRQLAELENNQIIEKSMSEYQSPIVMVKKKNGKYRMCCDFRKLNECTRPINFPIPRLVECLDSIAQAKPTIFSCLDLFSGFHQIPLDPETKHKTAFVTHQGQYQFTSMPFGLKNAPATFQMAMSEVFRGMNWKNMLVYIDDLILFSNSYEKHMSELKDVFDRLRHYNLKLQPAKCKFGARSVTYLGNIISKHGIAVDPAKTKAMSTFPVPKNQKDVRSFLGLANFNRRFIKNFAGIAAPLNALLKKDEKFEWTPECEKAFQHLRNALTNPPVLAYPDFDKEFILTCDASGYAISFILGQLDDNNKQRAICYGGRALSPRERKFTISERECLAVVDGIKNYHHYLANAHFQVFTDHSALKFLKTIKESTSPRLARWALLLQGYDFTINFKPGSQNKCADALSRREYPQCETDNGMKNQPQPRQNPAHKGFNFVANVNADKKEWCTLSLYYSEQPQVPVLPVGTVRNHDAENSDGEENASLDFTQLPNLKQLQRRCEDFSKLFKYMEEGILPNNKRECTLIAVESEQYVILDGLLYHIYQPRTKGLPKADRLIKQLALPRCLRRQVLNAFHDSVLGGAHQGFERTYLTIKNRYYWPKMYSDIEYYVKSCDACQHAKALSHSKNAPLHPLKVEDTFSRIHVDILGPLPESKPHKYKYILVVIDSFSKWVEAFPLVDQSAKSIADKLYSEIFTRYGACDQIVSDRGQNFLSKLVAALCELFDVKRFSTSPYHPASNAAVERFNKTIGQGLRIYCNEAQTNWPEILPSLLMGYRMAPCTQSTTLSPYSILFGKEMRTFVDVALLPKQSMGHSARQYIETIQKNIELSKKIAKHNLEKAQQRNKEYYDRKAREPDFRVGQQVLKHNPKTEKGKSPKLQRKWTERYYISRVFDDNTYLLRRNSDNKLMKTRIHANRLKFYYDPVDRRHYLRFEDENDDDETEQTQSTQNTQSQNDVNDDDDTQPVDQNSQSQASTAPQTQPDRSQPDVNDTGNDWHPVEKILRANRYRGKMWYRVKFVDGKSQWIIEDNVSPALIREFHINKTLQGKSRKKPQNKSLFHRQ